jgi:hypothetical protein
MEKYQSSRELGLKDAARNYLHGLLNMLHQHLSLNDLRIQRCQEGLVDTAGQN